MYIAYDKAMAAAFDLF